MHGSYTWRGSRMVATGWPLEGPWPWQSPSVVTEYELNRGDRVKSLGGGGGELEGPQQGLTRWWRLGTTSNFGIRCSCHAWCFGSGSRPGPSPLHQTTSPKDVGDTVHDPPLVEVITKQRSHSLLFPSTQWQLGQVYGDDLDDNNCSGKWEKKGKKGDKMDKEKYKRRKEGKRNS